MRRIKSIVLIICLVVCCTACNVQSDFNAYKHMTRILTITTQDQYERDRDNLLAHVSTDLQTQIDLALTGTIYDTSYSMTEREAYIEQDNDRTSILIEYDCTSNDRDYTLVAFFVYESNILVQYSTHKVYKTMEF